MKKDYITIRFTKNSTSPTFKEWLTANYDKLTLEEKAAINDSQNYLGKSDSEDSVQEDIISPTEFVHRIVGWTDSYDPREFFFKITKPVFEDILLKYKADYPDANDLDIFVEGL